MEGLKGSAGVPTRPGAAGRRWPTLRHFHPRFALPSKCAFNLRHARSLALPDRLREAIVRRGIILLIPRVSPCTAKRKGKLLPLSVWLSGCLSVCSSLSVTCLCLRQTVCLFVCLPMCPICINACFLFLHFTHEGHKS